MSSLDSNVRSLPSSHFSHGSGGGGSDLESRVSVLENNVEHIKAGITDVKSDIRDIKSDMVDIKVMLATNSAKLDDKVGYKWMVLYVLGIIAVILRSEIAAFLHIN